MSVLRVSGEIALYHRGKGVLGIVVQIFGHRVDDNIGDLCREYAPRRKCALRMCICVREGVGGGIAGYALLTFLDNPLRKIVSNGLLHYRAIWAHFIAVCWIPKWVVERTV